MTTEKCLQCENGTLTPSMVSLRGTRNNEEFTVTVPGLHCTVCGFATIDNRQSGEFTRAISDAYREAHSLLTGAELKSRRSQWLKMSQQQFADYLGVGIASVKRWESGQVQDRAMDELLRLKTDPVAARSNLHALETQIAEDCILSSVNLGDEGLDLRFSLDPNYTEKPQMEMGAVKMSQPPEFWEDELLVA